MENPEHCNWPERLWTDFRSAAGRLHRNTDKRYPCTGIQWFKYQQRYNHWGDSITRPAELRWSSGRRCSIWRNDSSIWYHRQLWCTGTERWNRSAKRQQFCNLKQHLSVLWWFSGSSRTDNCRCKCRSRQSSNGYGWIYPSTDRDS